MSIDSPAPFAATAFRICFAVVIFTASPAAAFAEGRCPPGQVPIGGQGVGGCMPVGSSGGESTGPVPTGRWIKTWGAIATSKGGDAGVSVNQLKKADAVKEALERCAAWGAKDCKVGLAYKNQCVAAVAADKGLGTKLNTGETIDVAVQRATADCKSSGSKTCKVDYSACSEPYFHSY